MMRGSLGRPSAADLESRSYRIRWYLVLMFTGAERYNVVLPLYVTAPGVTDGAAGAPVAALARCDGRATRNWHKPTRIGGDGDQLPGIGRGGGALISGPS